MKNLFAVIMLVGTFGALGTCAYYDNQCVEFCNNACAPDRVMDREHCYSDRAVCISKDKIYVKEISK